MALILRVSPTVREWLGFGIVAERNPRSRYDLTLIAPEDYGPWVEHAHRRLRPHFVNSPQEALKVWKTYERLGNGDQQLDRDSDHFPGGGDGS